MTLHRRDFLRVALAAGATASATGVGAAGASESDAIVVRAPDLFPENMGYLEATRRFYVGSVRYGRVSSVSESGSIATLCDDPRLVSTFGIYADRARGLLYVCNADVGLGVRSRPATKGRICGLATVDARSGKLVRYVDIIGAEPGSHLPNDCAIARDGSIYVTDTLAPLLHRVAPDGRAEIFVRDDRFAPKPAAGLDGIVIAATGTIVINHISGGKFFRIDPATKAVAQVVVDGGTLLVGCDGMRLEPDGRLIVSRSTLPGPAGRNMLCALTTTDDWRTATIAHEWPLTATTYQSVRTPSGVYGVQSRLELLFRKGGPGATVPSFTIRRITA